VGKFDVILCLGVLYHVPDPFLALHIIRGLMRDGGTLFLESTNLAAGASWRNGEVMLPEQMRDLPLALLSRRNVSSFWDMTPACMRQMLSDNGFRVASEETWGRRILFKADCVR
jgi:tRNA (mo5U34)-methyltransferase